MKPTSSLNDLLALHRELEEVRGRLWELHERLPFKFSLGEAASIVQEAQDRLLLDIGQAVIEERAG